jgi:hypothetical protein
MEGIETFEIGGAKREDIRCNTSPMSDPTADGRSMGFVMERYFGTGHRFALLLLFTFNQ